MSTLDEITKEKQRIAEALARAEAQREKLTGQLGELEAAERVLARYSKGTPVRKIASAKTPTTATKAAAAPQHQAAMAELTSGSRPLWPALTNSTITAAAINKIPERMKASK